MACRSFARPARWPPQDNGVLDAARYRALRTGTIASGVWAVCATLLVPLTISDASGHPVTEFLNPATIWSTADLIDTASAWRWTAFLAALVTIASLPVLRWSLTPFLFAGSLVTLIPVGRRTDQRTATRLDRAADRDEYAELAAYNAMLAEMSRRESGGSSQH
jgi:hypothetical protein